jgi:hypothetical protein
MNEADFPSINIASGVEGDEVTEGIPDPYADQSPRIEVPEMVYTQDAPYDTSVVEIGEKVRPESVCVCGVTALVNRNRIAISGKCGPRRLRLGGRRGGEFGIAVTCTHAAV